MRKKERVKKPGKVERHIAETRDNWAHAATPSILRSREVVNHQLLVIDDEISSTLATLSSLREHRKMLEAEATGLTLVIERR